MKEVSVPGRPAVAFCFTGQPRTLTHPLTRSSLLKHAVRGFGARVTSFFYLTNDDQGASSYGGPAVDVDVGEVQAAMAALHGAPHAFQYYGPLQLSNIAETLPADCLTQLQASTQNKPYGRHSGIPRWVAWWQTYVKLRHCYEQVIRYEEQHAMGFRWIVRIRPDLFFFGPMPHFSVVSDIAITTPAGVIGCKEYPCLNDHLAIVPRALATGFFNASNDIDTCKNAREAQAFLKNFGSDFATYLHKRLVRDSIPVVFPSPLIPYTLMRPCLSQQQRKTRVYNQLNSSRSEFAVSPECHRYADMPFSRHAGLKASNSATWDAAQPLQTLRAYGQRCHCNWITEGGLRVCPVVGAQWEDDWIKYTAHWCKNASSASRFTIAAFDQNDCPSGWGHLTKAEACRAAANELGMKNNPRDAIFINRDNPARPNGCFQWFSAAVHFNTLTDSPPGPVQGAPVCQRVTRQISRAPYPAPSDPPPYPFTSHTTSHHTTPSRPYPATRSTTPQPSQPHPLKASTPPMKDRCQLVQNRTCTRCAASVEDSFAEFGRSDVVELSLFLHIISRAVGCRRKMSGGDAWVVLFEGANGASWRSMAQYHRTGEYRVPIPLAWRKALPIVAHVQLWWTKTMSGDVLAQWDQRAHAAPGAGQAGSMFARLDRDHGDDTEWVPLQCVGGYLPPLSLNEWPVSETTEPQRISSPCTRTELRTGGWWVKRGAQRLEWAPSWCSDDTWGDSDFDATTVRSCLGGRQLLILGDSVTAGTYLDLCALLSNHGAHIACATAFSSLYKPVSPLPSTEVAFAPLFGNFPVRHIGLPNLINSSQTAEWERIFTAANDTLVILQSGLHDIGVPPLDRPKPLLAWEHNLRSLGAFITRVQLANPRVQFIWRAMTHALLRTCAQGFPQTYPPLVHRMNQLAADILRPFGVTVWGEPALMSWSAPITAFKDLNHHDVCGMAAGLGRGTRCADQRSRGHILRARSNFYVGGLSETITQSLFRVMGCKVSPPSAEKFGEGLA